MVRTGQMKSISRLWRPSNLLFGACAVFANQVATPAFADPPTTKRLEGTLVTPSAAATFYGTDTTHTNGLASTPARSPEIKALARSLSRGGALTGDAFAQRVADYVRRNIEVEFRYGLGKGARGAVIDQSGTVFDQAQLMVEVLREGGLAATYQLGTITLDADQFGKWTGLVTSPIKASQAFTVNARSACQLLADGGIPATVNGALSCTELSSTINTTLNTVTLSHIWVLANGKAYDPAYKVSILGPGIDVPAAMGCGTAAAPTCGLDLETAALTLALQGTANGAPYIQNVNQTAVESYIQARAVQLQSVIESTDPTAAIEDVVGGAVIDIKQVVAGAASLPYPSSAQGSAWSGDIPNSYRVKFRVQFMGLDVSLYADEISGRRLRLATLARVDSLDRTTKVFLDGTEIASGTAVGSVQQVDRPIISIDHPMAGAGPLAGALLGSYGDTTISLAMGTDPRSLVQVINPPGIKYCYVVTGTTTCGNSYYAIRTLVLDVGSAGAARPDHFSKLLVDFKEEMIEPTMTGGSDLNALKKYRHPEAPSMAAKFLHQSDLAFRRIEALAGVKLEQFHAVGALFSESDPGDGQLRFNLSTSLASTHKSSITNDASAAFLTAAAAAAGLEGSVFQQQGDAFESSASVSMFKLANAQGYRFYNTNSSNIATVLASATNYIPAKAAVLTSLAAAGYEVILPSNAYVGAVNLSGGGTYTIIGGPELAMRSGEIAYLVSEEYKGGGAATTIDPVKNSVQSTTADSHSLKDKKYFGVDLASGTMNLSPPPDLIVGTADSALEFSRSYSSTSSAALQCNLILKQFAPELDHNDCRPIGLPTGSIVGGGWNHNLNMSAGWAGSGGEGLGKTSALRGARGIASLYALFDVNRLNTFQRKIATIFTTYSFLNSFVRNSVSIQAGGGSEFVRLPNGRFDPPPSARDQTLSLAGAPSDPGVLPNGSQIVRNYFSTEFTHTSGDGSVTVWRPAEAYGNPVPYADIGNYSAASIAANFSADKMQIYAPLTTSRGNGSKYTFNYLIHRDYLLGSSRKIVSSISGSLGHAVTLSYNNLSVSSNTGLVINNQTYIDGVARIGYVEDDTGRRVTVQCITLNNPAQGDPAASYYGFPLSGHRKVRFFYGCTGGVTDPVNGVSKYSYPSGDGTFAGSLYPDRVLKSWSTPLNVATPFLTWAYDPVLHVSSYTDISNKRTDVYTSTIADDRYRIGETKDPAGAIASTIFDENASALQVTDPLGRVTSNVYDSARRLLRTVFPEGNAVEYSYDMRGNKTRECSIPKDAVTWASMGALNEKTPRCNTSRTPVADLAMTTTYVEAANLRADQCVNMKTCNKPLFTIDPKGNRTDYTWSPTHGQLLTETKPTDPAGLRPLTTYDYTPFPGVDGATFYLLTSKIEKIDATNTTTTTYEYNTANKFVLKSQVVDSGGLALRTCFKFDATGNLISKTEPKAGLTSCP